ncbi:MAG TPA: fluoride efflux transporter CrcB [Candidatus Binatia bacterium]|jgi:CrcB protein
MSRFLLICLGGAAGTGARYLLSGWVMDVVGPAFPFGTLAVNSIGSFLLSIVLYASVEASAISPTARLVLGTGVMGGFTTYSTFNYETMRYLQDGAFGVAALNLLVTFAGCMSAGIAGWMTARSLFGTF